MKLRGIVALVGRPNVGKVHSLISHRQTAALADPRPGVTRDRIYGEVPDTDEHAGFLLIDTGGFETADNYYQPFSDNIVGANRCGGGCRLVVLVTDGVDGMHPHDRELAFLA